MRHYEDVAIPAKIGRKLIKITCDLCGAEAKKGFWESSSYTVADVVVNVRQRDGESFPEGGSGTEYEVDMCPKCFKDKLIPWLESQGCKAERTQWEW